MAEPLLKMLGKAWPLAVVAVALVVFSAFHAQRSCDSVLAGEVSPPPHFSTRFVLHPAHHMDGARDLGLAPGWVVTYAPRGQTYGTAFFVGLFGKMLARGEPAIVSKHREQAQASLGKFRAEFARVDSAVTLGSTFSNALALLGEPIATFTNSDGSMEAHFSYLPAAIGQVSIDWLTNGFTLLVSNNVVVRKGYSYTSSR